MWHITNLVTHHNYNMSAGQTSTTTHKPLFDTKLSVAFYTGKFHMNKFRKTKYGISASIPILSITSCLVDRRQQQHVCLCLRLNFWWRLYWQEPHKQTL